MDFLTSVLLCSTPPSSRLIIWEVVGEEYRYEEAVCLQSTLTEQCDHQTLRHLLLSFCLARRFEFTKQTVTEVYPGNRILKSPLNKYPFSKLVHVEVECKVQLRMWEFCLYLFLICIEIVFTAKQYNLILPRAPVCVRLPSHLFWLFLLILFLCWISLASENHTSTSKQHVHYNTNKPLNCYLPGKTEH